MKVWESWGTMGKLLYCPESPSLHSHSSDNNTNCRVVDKLYEKEHVKHNK